jgi:[ribosomal protein S18]-alanine N-acetyltransferase
VSVELRIATMRRRDIKRIMVIERLVYPEPWSVTIFNSELALKKGRAYRVAWVGKEVVGYLGLMFVDGESHVTTVAVAPAYQRQGVATQLLLYAMRLSLEEGCRSVSLEVAAGNERAQGLYRRFGLAPVGVRKGYYPLTGEDAFVMFVYDIDSPEYAERLERIEATVRSVL